MGSLCLQVTGSLSRAGQYAKGIQQGTVQALLKICDQDGQLKGLRYQVYRFLIILCIFDILWVARAVAICVYIFSTRAVVLKAVVQCA